MPSWLATKRMAQEAKEAFGLASARICFTLGMGSASRPPFTGSMTTTGLPWALQISRLRFEATPGFSQSA